VSSHTNDISSSQVGVDLPESLFSPAVGLGVGHNLELRERRKGGREGGRERGEGGVSR